MQEFYNWSGQIKRLSPHQIRKMKENMRKVPEIQKKSEIYHLSESENAEKLLNQYMEKEDNHQIKNTSTNGEKITVWQKIIKYLFK